MTEFAGLRMVLDESCMVSEILYQLPSLFHWAVVLSTLLGQGTSPGNLLKVQISEPLTPDPLNQKLLLKPLAFTRPLGDSDAVSSFENHSDGDSMATTWDFCEFDTHCCSTDGVYSARGSFWRTELITWMGVGGGGGCFYTWCMHSCGKNDQLRNHVLGKSLE